jgi:hypothetical protein
MLTVPECDTQLKSIALYDAVLGDLTTYTTLFDNFSGMLHWATASSFHHAPLSLYYARIRYKGSHSTLGKLMTLQLWCLVLHACQFLNIPYGRLAERVLISS